MAECKACGAWFASAEPQDLCPTCERALKRLKGYAAPVVHGEWMLRHVGHGHYWECSVCHKNPCIYVTENTNYCPNCGAKMDGGD